jgi:hypothetical protein
MRFGQMEGIMIKASFTMTDGTIVNIEGEPGKVKEFFDLLGHTSSTPAKKPKVENTAAKTKKENTPGANKRITAETITQIVNLIKSCKEAEAIEKNILKSSNDRNRALLPLYIVHEYLENAYELSTVEIDHITSELGSKVKVSRQNVNRAFVRKETSKYVLADTTRKSGRATRYKLNDRGIEYMRSVLANGDNSQND